jgi:hypothetical protein
MVYPPKSSSAPSPESTTFTCSLASLAMNHSGTSAGSATGSSRYHTISGSASANSVAETVRITCRTSIVAADSAATSTSEYPSRSKPVVKVIRSGLCSLASAAMAVESIPPDKKAPTVTSARMCLATESRSAVVISSCRAPASAAERTGRGRKSGWK